MKTIYHKPIKRFGLGGQIHDDADLFRLRYEYNRIVLLQMKMSGYVPRLDIDTEFTLSYNHKSEYFEFELSIYGIYVGKKKSKCIIGVAGNQVLYSHPSKQRESLSESA
jgi:hypothetical protein